MTDFISIKMYVTVCILKCIILGIPNWLYSIDVMTGSTNQRTRIRQQFEIFS